jgi:hypothetical protein
VESIARSSGRRWLFIGSTFTLAMASMNFADVPKCVMSSAAAKSKSTLPRPRKGEPS